MEIFEGMDFASAEDRTKLNIVVNKFKELCLDERNEIYERFILNKRQKKENKTVEQYVTVDWSSQSAKIQLKINYYKIESSPCHEQ